MEEVIFVTALQSHSQLVPQERVLVVSLVFLPSHSWKEEPAGGRPEAQDHESGGLADTDTNWPVQVTATKQASSHPYQIFLCCPNPGTENYVSEIPGTLLPQGRLHVQERTGPVGRDSLVKPNPPWMLGGDWVYLRGCSPRFLQHPSLPGQPSSSPSSHC